MYSNASKLRQNAILLQICEACASLLHLQLHGKVTAKRV